MEWTRNNEGYIVWVGAGNTAQDGITKNLWQAVLPGCIKNGAALNVTGEVDCKKQGGTVNAPWGQPQVHWGMLTVLRDSTASAVLKPLGNTLPDFRVGFSQNLQWRRINLYGLVDVSVGNKLMNEEIHWSLGDFMVDEEDQAGKSVEDAKPIGYYWRAPNPENGAGVGGFYDVLGSNTHTVQSGTYTKIREISLTYNLGKVRGIAGEWNVSAIGRNLYTFTNFRGWDPEVGITGGNLNSSALNAVAAYQYPPRRSFTLTLGSRF
jgi:hypothetical protein